MADSCCTGQHGSDMASAQDTPIAAALCPSWLPQPSCFGCMKLMVSLILPTLSQLVIFYQKSTHDSGSPFDRVR